MTLLVECVPAPDEVAIPPCGEIGGVGYAPIMRSISDTPALDYSGLGALFSWAVSFVLIAFVVGLTVGAILRVIRSA